MIVKVSTNFGRLSDTELDNFAQGVIDALTGNATYPTPPVTLANLQAAVDDYTAKMAAAQTGGVADTAAKNNARNTLEEMLRKVATYVQMMCNEDPALLLTSGFQSHFDTIGKAARPEHQERRGRPTGRAGRCG
jgi:hypothetical protein